MKYQAPYQIFFPFGILCSLLGAGLWLFQDFNFGVPIMFIHSKLMTGGFLWSFITGFLMTAIPKMAGAEPARKSEVGAAMALVLSQFYFAWSLGPVGFFGTHILLALFLITFAAVRISKMTKKIPVFFSHIGLAFLCTLIGSYYSAINDYSMGLHLFYIAPVLLLVLGIGTRFYSFLSGLPSVFEESSNKFRIMLFHFLGLGVVFALFGAGLGYRRSYLFLSFLLMAYMIFIWKVFRPSLRPSPLKYATRFIALSLPLSFFLCWMWPVYQIAWLHLLFIGCFSLITYSVATRVTLAHGSYSLNLETTSRSLWFFCSLLLLALGFRTIYAFVDYSNKSQLLYVAVFLWILAILVWSSGFLIKIFKSGQLEKPSC